MLPQAEHTKFVTRANLTRLSERNDILLNGELAKPTLNNFFGTRKFYQSRG